jgi:hypothetical protein
MNDVPTDDPRLIWQGLRREHAIMSVEEVRSKAQAVEARARRTLFVAMSVGAVVVGLSGLVVFRTGMTPVRWIAGGIMAVTVISVYQAYSRIWSRHSLTPETAVAGCIDFYRQELTAQYNSLQLIWRLMLPLVVFTFLLWSAVFHTSRFVPRYFLFAVLLVILVERRREAGRVRRKLAELAEFEKENS